MSITPGSGYVAPWASIIFGVLGAASCNLAIRLKQRLGYNDQLDAFGLHAVGASAGEFFSLVSFTKPTSSTWMAETLETEKVESSRDNVPCSGIRLLHS
jgi:ammonia channel protein AmtB